MNNLEKLRGLLGLDYEDFVKKLGEFADDDKLVAAIQTGRKDGMRADDQVQFKEVSIPVTSLRPTQNEIDVDKSLRYSLEGKNPQLLKSIMDGKDVMVVSPIVTMNGQFIIDGHHRWSQVYAMNKDATIKCLDMKTTAQPLRVLKAVQMAIAVKVGEVPVARVEGRNLLTIDKDALEEYIRKVLTDEAKKIIGKEEDEVAKEVWDNVRNMQHTSKPIKGAPSRNVMPQTDVADKAGGEHWTKYLAKGVINFKKPYASKGDEAQTKLELAESRVMSFGKWMSSRGK